MSFIDLFLPMFLAFIAASIVMEILHFLLGLWLATRQAKATKAHFEKMAAQLGIDPEELQAQMESYQGMGGMGMMDMMGSAPGSVMTTTTSGSREHHGQYL